MAPAEVAAFVVAYVLVAIGVGIATLADLLRGEARRNQRCKNKEEVSISHGICWPLVAAIGLIQLSSLLAYKLARVEKLPEVRQRRKVELQQEIERLEQETKEEDEDVHT